MIPSQTINLTPSDSGPGSVGHLTRRVFAYALFFSLMITILNMAVPVNMFAMYSLVVPSQDTGNAVVITGGVLVLLALLAGVLYLRSRMMVDFGGIIDRELSPKIIGGMLQDAARQQQRSRGDSMGDLSRIRNFLGSPLVFAYFETLLAPVKLLVVYLLSPLLALVAVLALLVVVLLTWRLQKLTGQPLKDASALAVGNNSFLQECLRNLEAVKSMGMVSPLVRRWQKSQDGVLALQFSASEQAGVLSALTKTITMSMSILMLGIGAFLVITSPDITPIAVIIASMMAGQMMGPAHQAISGWNSLQEVLLSYGRLKELLAELDRSPPRMELPPPEGRLTAEQLSYAVPGQILLQGVSFDLNPGEFLGIIGPMAAGKTTLARLLTGVVSPQGGKVRLDGADMHIWDQSNLGPHLGYLPQEVELFPGTIGENITRMAAPDREQLEAALRRSGLEETVKRLPDGLETVIEERGGNLPGGLRQRIGLARALYGSPRLVILDEPDANLDEDGRRCLILALDELKRLKSTVVMVTHRVSLLKQADKILVLTQGRPVLYGPAAEVWAKLTPANKTRAIGER